MLPRQGRSALLCLAATIATLLLANCSLGHRPAHDTYEARVREIVAPYTFNIARWEIRAVSAEISECLFLGALRPVNPNTHMQVLAYLATADKIGSLTQELQRTVATCSDKEQCPRQLQALQIEIEALRALQQRRRPLVERTLAIQVARVIAEERIGWFGTGLPPPAFDFTEPPSYLVLSPRDEIRLKLSIYLVPGLALEERKRLERELERELPNTSALISDTGGFSTWPTMIVERAGIEWVLSTIAHEWTHMYLEPFPLGRHYHASPEVTAINETVAQLVGDELGARVLGKYYPQFAAATTARSEAISPQTERAVDESAFDFNQQMRITRETVDILLEKGLVGKAEEYMEERRQIFLEHGFYIRRLNQAYFAFHGSYRTGPATPKDDPIAPRLRKLRTESADLAAFLRGVRGISSVDDLLARVPTP